MFKNYFISALRSMKRYKGFAAINILGLSIGLMVSILIAAFVIFEFSYDHFHKHSDTIYRVVLNGQFQGQDLTGSNTCVPLAPAITRDYPEVTEALRILPAGEMNLQVDDRNFLESEVLYVDSNFFHFFDFELIQGNGQEVLKGPNKMVITQSAARRLFGSEPAVGQSVRINNDTTYYEITGLAADPPGNTSIAFDFLLSFASSDRRNQDNWLANFLYTYIRLQPGTNADELDNKLYGLLVDYVEPQLIEVLDASLEDFEASGNRYEYNLQAMSHVHLNTEIGGGIVPATQVRYLYIFAAIALFIIVIATINYMNLATARAAGRAREVGIRKVLGSQRKQLIGQFLTESVLISLFALILALVLVELVHPYFNSLVHVEMDIAYFTQWYYIPLMVVFALLVGLLAGSYPAFYLSAFRPVKVLKGQVVSGKSGNTLRRILVVTQYIISIGILFSTLVVSQQLHYIQNKDLGFNKDQVMIIRNMDRLADQQDSFKEKIRRHAGVQQASYSTAIPGYPNNNNGYMLQGRPGQETFLLVTNWVDYQYHNTMDLTMHSGRWFSPEYASDSSACVISERAVEALGLENPLGTIIKQPGRGEFIPHKVIGVVEDFHASSIHIDYQPMIFLMEEMGGYFLNVKIQPQNMQSVVQYAEKTWREYTDGVFNYSFLKEDWANLYEQEQRTAYLNGIFSLLAIAIALMGVLGLVAFMANRRTREIGIRKTLGASVARISYLLTREIIVLVLIASVIAWPVAYWLMTQWLENFVFHINPSVLYLLAASLAVLLLSVLTISFLTIKAARQNPAEALRYE